MVIKVNYEQSHGGTRFNKSEEDTKARSTRFTLLRSKYETSPVQLFSQLYADMYTINIITAVITTVTAMEGVASFKVREKEARSFYSYMYNNTTYSIYRSKNRCRPLFSTN
jgi:hypothetical protein